MLEFITKHSKALADARREATLRQYEALQLEHCELERLAIAADSRITQARDEIKRLDQAAPSAPGLPAPPSIDRKIAALQAGQDDMVSRLDADLAAHEASLVAAASELEAAVRDTGISSDHDLRVAEERAESLRKQALAAIEQVERIQLAKLAKSNAEVKLEQRRASRLERIAKNGRELEALKARKADNDAKRLSLEDEIAQLQAARRKADEARRQLHEFARNNGLQFQILST